LEAGNGSLKNPSIVQLEIFDGIAGLIGISLSDLYQKLFDESAKPIGGYFLEDFAIDLIFDCHNSAPKLEMPYGLFRENFYYSTTHPAQMNLQL
jgi:hypothetical protein